MADQSIAPDSEDARLARRSQWTLVGLSVGSALLACYLLRLYSVVHWDIRGNECRLEHAAKGFAIEAMIRASEEDKARLEQEFREFCEESERCSDASSMVMNALEAYHLAGLAACICSVIACLRRPRGIGLISLPFGVVGLFVAGVVM